VALDLSAIATASPRATGRSPGPCSPAYRIDSITNGVHSRELDVAALRDRSSTSTRRWREDNYELRHAVRIPDDALWNAHQDAKRILLRR
jgi:starch phosphorylase